MSNQEMNYREFDVNQFLSDIKLEIKKSGATSDVPSFEEIPYIKIKEVISDTEARDVQKNDINTLITDINSDYLVYINTNSKDNFAKKLCRKFRRRLFKFYVEPNVQLQNDFNGHMV